MGWWCVDLRHAEAEERVHLLEDPSITGFEVVDPTLVRVFVQGDEPCAARVSSLATEHDFAVESLAQVEERNWVQECADVWVPLQLGTMRVVPVTGPAHSLPPRSRGELRIIPGTGFGTGHHPSTANAILLLQQPTVAASPPRTALDVGTGNGILALAVAELYSASVDATDIDPLALVNARDNLQLNSFESLIALHEGAFPPEPRTYDLITANIYAEVLCQLEPELARHAREGSLLVLAGIMSSKTGMIEESFARNWQELARIPERDWTALLFSRRLSKAEHVPGGRPSMFPEGTYNEA